MYSLVSLGSLLAGGQAQAVGVSQTNYHCIINARDPVAAENPDRCEGAQRIHSPV